MMYTVTARKKQTSRRPAITDSTIVAELASGNDDGLGPEKRNLQLLKT